MSEPPRRPAERAAFEALPYLLVGLLLSVPLLLVPTQDEPLALFTTQLAMLVALGLLVTWRVAPLADAAWFTETSWGEDRRRLGGVVVLVIVPTGVVALVALASSAALRFDPSLQFLQLLSALDIAWAAAALYLGVRWWLGRGPARVASVMLGILCVLSVWNYLRVVGFGASGAWIVDGEQMLRLVLPFDTVAALMAIGSVILGLRRVREANGAGQ
ncbi:MAG TPA: hypothetical protein VLG28_10320 [Acidimicrobiia bacterium]|nr:hypothetical protein [Acidimicrobiia bacterium]